MGRIHGADTVVLDSLCNVAMRHRWRTGREPVGQAPLNRSVMAMSLRVVPWLTLVPSSLVARGQTERGPVVVLPDPGCDRAALGNGPSAGRQAGCAIGCTLRRYTDGRVCPGDPGTVTQRDDHRDPVPAMDRGVQVVPLTFDGDIAGRWLEQNGTHGLPWLRPTRRAWWHLDARSVHAVRELACLLHSSIPQQSGCPGRPGVTAISSRRFPGAASWQARGPIDATSPRDPKGAAGTGGRVVLTAFTCPFWRQVQEAGEVLPSHAAGRGSPCEWNPADAEPRGAGTGSPILKVAPLFSSLGASACSTWNRRRDCPDSLIAGVIRPEVVGWRALARTAPGRRRTPERHNVLRQVTPFHVERRPRSALLASATLQAPRSTRGPKCGTCSSAGGCLHGHPGSDG